MNLDEEDRRHVVAVPEGGPAAHPDGPGEPDHGQTTIAGEGGGAPDQAPLGPGDRRPDVGRGWDVLLGIDLGILALIGVLNAVALFTGAANSVEVTAEALWLQNALFVVLLGVIPFLWVWRTRVGGMHGVVAYLRLHRPLWGFGVGLLALLGIYAILIVIGLLIQQFAPDLAENPALEDMGRVLTWELVVAMALVAGITEEILFRGVLQKWIGVWGQALAFALLHLGYATLMQFVLPLLIGLAFGYMVRRGIPLWAPITAHVLYDLVALSFTKFCADNAAHAVCAG